MGACWGTEVQLSAGRLGQRRSGENGDTIEDWEVFGFELLVRRRGELLVDGKISGNVGDEGGDGFEEMEILWELGPPWYAQGISQADHWKSTSSLFKAKGKTHASKIETIRWIYL
jgi:hypothetical protein